MSTDLPATAWRGNGTDEITVSDANTVADAAAYELADASGNTVVDSGATVVSLPATVWTSDDSR